ncbi:MAG: elongation factor G, partial [Oscillospiraceae bacterium]|nr:elongation factor G [Oscillospiraceae bacterium]
MDIRNICLLGHGGSGKTSLVESMLYITGVTDRLGKSADGNTVCDYDPEEIKRQISISLAMTPINYGGVKINVLDAPGNFDFAGEMQSGVRAAEVGVLVCASKDGLSVGAERCWKYLKEQKKPCIVYISKEDEENANFSTT